VSLQNLAKLFVLPTAIFHVYLIQIYFESNDFWIWILKDSNPKYLIFHYMHP